MFRPRSPRQTRLTGMGADTSSSVQVDTADILNLGQQLRDAQSRLTTLVAQMRQDSELAAAIGRDVTAQQAQLSDLTSRYVYAYTAVFGQAPVGLGNPVLVAAAVAILISYVAAQLYLWYQKQKTLEEQAQAQVLAEQNRASVINMAQQQQDIAAKAAASGDSATAATATAAAQQILQEAGIPGQYGPPPPSQTFSDWIKANWIIAAGIGAAVFFLPKLAGR